MLTTERLKWIPRPGWAGNLRYPRTCLGSFQGGEPALHIPPSEGSCTDYRCGEATVEMGRSPTTDTGPVDQGIVASLKNALISGICPQGSKEGLPSPRYCHGSGSRCLGCGLWCLWRAVSQGGHRGFRPK